MTTQPKARAKKHGVTWPSQKAFDLASQYTREGSERHLAAALMLHKPVTMEAIEAVTGAPQYNVVALLKAKGCKQATGTDREGYRLYGFTLPKSKN